MSAVSGATLDARPAAALDPAALRLELPKELFELPLASTFLKALLLIAVSAALMTGVTLTDHPLLFVPLAFMLGLSLFTLAAVGHESGHLTASRNAFLNDLTGLFTMSFIGMPARGWKVYHDIHHRSTGVLGVDTDAQYTVAQYVLLAPRQRRIIRWVNEHEFLFWPLGALFIFGICWSYAADIALHPAKYSRRVRMWNFADIAMSLTIMTGVATYAVLLGASQFAAAILLPLMVGGFVGAATFTTNHRNLPPLTREEAKRVRSYFHVNTRTLTFPRWLPGNWFTSYVPWQIEHHLFPTIPGPKLARVSPWVQRHAQSRGVPLQYMDYFRCSIEVARTRHAWGADGRLHSFADIDRLLAAGTAMQDIPGFEVDTRAVPRRDLRDILGLR